MSSVLSKRRQSPLREFRWIRGVCLDVCRNAASTTKNFLVFAATLQVPRKTFWRLQECCKCHEKLFGVCNTVASLTKNFLVFATPLQVPRKTFWRLRESRKSLEKLFSICGSSAEHFQKHFDPRVASVETLCRLYAFVEHTFSICVFDVVPPPKVDYNRYRSMLLS